jgi:predicted RNA binding protein YcfA (HicA-like mRNA interferase family)
MGQRDKLVSRFKAKPTDFTWDELVRVLESLGYREAAAGRTGGSRRRFVHPTAAAISLHRPHPGSIVKLYVVKDLLRVLTEEGLI